MPNEPIIRVLNPFKYKGRTVIGAKPPTTKQHIITYIPIWIYAAALIYVVIRAMICDCAFLYVHEAVLVGVVTIATFGWTVLMKRRFEKQNYVYEDEKN